MVQQKEIKKVLFFQVISKNNNNNMHIVHLHHS
jgi:hypothetical protein